MSISTTSEFNFLPNLPGYRSHEIPLTTKKHFFKIIDGLVIPKEEYLPAVNTIDDELGSVGTIGSPKLRTRTKSRKSGNDKAILTFHAYFEEYPENGNPKRIRKVNVFYYVEDGTIKIVEKPQMNSGLTQGTIVLRAVIGKPNGFPYLPEDLQIGTDLIVYGRKFRLVDCDAFTKKYLDLEYIEPLVVPTDSYEQYRMTLQSGPSSEWGKFHSKKNVDKIYLEAKLGNSVDNKGREGFIRYGNKKLVFRGVWDNTASLYGDVVEFSLNYYLSDDTVEIISLPGSHGKEFHPTKLLKRSKLPKNFENSMNLWDKVDENSFFYWYELYVGMEVEVYGRYLKIIDADASTREFYENADVTLDSKIPQPIPEAIVHEREIPPSTGFGSEEDSLRSCFGPLMPGPVPIKKLGESKVLAFSGCLLSGTVDDKDRKFVLSYYLQDSTLKIIEPPVRNSGFTGGVFLSRRVIKLENGEQLNEKDLFVGAKLKILKHVFLLENVNEATFRWLEDKGLPRSNFYTILDKIRFHILNDAENGTLEKKFRAKETLQNGANLATKDTLLDILSEYNLIGDNVDELSEHELRTIVRANGNRTPFFNYVKFIEQVKRPTDEFR